MANEQTGLLVTPNFSEVQDRVSEGIYQARIVDSKSDKWEGKLDLQTGKKNPDTTIIVWTMETFNEADEKNNGRKIFHRTPIEGPGAFRLQDFYQAAMGEQCTGAFDPTMLHGREIEVTYGPQKKNPEYSEVKAVKPISH